jgi:hypothetical protein
MRAAAARGKVFTTRRFDQTRLNDPKKIKNL